MVRKDFEMVVLNGFFEWFLVQFLPMPSKRSNMKIQVLQVNGCCFHGSETSKLYQLFLSFLDANQRLV